MKLLCLFKNVFVAVHQILSLFPIFHRLSPIFSFKNNKNKERKTKNFAKEDENMLFFSILKLATGPSSSSDGYSASNDTVAINLRLTFYLDVLFQNGNPNK